MADLIKNFVGIPLEVDGSSVQRLGVFFLDRDCRAVQIIRWNGRGETGTPEHIVWVWETLFYSVFGVSDGGMKLNRIRNS